MRCKKEVAANIPSLPGSLENKQAGPCRINKTGETEIHNSGLTIGGSGMANN